MNDRIEFRHNRTADWQTGYIDYTYNQKKKEIRLWVRDVHHRLHFVLKGNTRSVCTVIDPQEFHDAQKALPRTDYSSYTK